MRDVSDDGSSEHRYGGVFLWQGFEHEWLRSVLGFSVPHRVSRLDNYIDRQRSEDWRRDASADFHFGQETGVDGNYMQPIGRYAALSAAHLCAHSGVAEFAWTDEGEGKRFPQARSDLAREVHVPATALSADMEGGGYVAVLNGIALRSRCDPAKQPSTSPGNSHGFWPFKLAFRVGDVSASADGLRFDVSAAIHRAWTPMRGGLPPFEEKPFNHRLDYELEIHYAVLGMAAGHLVTARERVELSGSVHDRRPRSGRVTLPLDGAAVGSFGIAGFGFELKRSGTAERFGHLGRYISGMTLGADAAPLDADRGVLDVDCSLGVWCPKTVVNSHADYFLDVVGIGLPESATVLAGGRARGKLCSNSHGAPFFSVWNGCDDSERGPECRCYTVPIRAEFSE